MFILMRISEATLSVCVCVVTVGNLTAYLVFSYPRYMTIKIETVYSICTVVCILAQRTIPVVVTISVIVNCYCRIDVISRNQMIR